MATVLPPEDLATLRAELAGPAYAGMDLEARLHALQVPEPVPNPAPRGHVPRPFAASDVLEALSPESRAKLTGVAFLPAIRDAINSQDRAACSLWVQVLVSGAIVTPEEGAALAGLLSATTDDPAWPATVPGPTPKQRLFGDRRWTYPDGRTVDYVPPDDVEAASS